MHIRQYIYIYAIYIYIRFICIFVSAADSPPPGVQNFDNSEPGGFPRGTYVYINVHINVHMCTYVYINVHKCT